MSWRVLSRFLIIAFSSLSVCLCGFANAQYLWCMDEDEVYAQVEGRQLTIFHDAALYNCCWNPMEYIVYWQDGQLHVEEYEILQNGCWCLCCYDLSVTVPDLPPGQWTVLFNWENEETGQWQEVVLEVVIPEGPEVAAGTLEGDYWRSPCLLAPSAVPDLPGLRQVEWDGLKACYC
jgi:hypothetical protein